MLHVLLPILAQVFTSRQNSLIQLVKDVLTAPNIGPFNPGWVSHLGILGPMSAYKALEQATLNPWGLLPAAALIHDAPTDFVIVDATFIEKPKSTTSPNRLRTVFREGFRNFRKKIGWQLLVAVLVDDKVVSNSWVTPLWAGLSTPSTQTQQVIEAIKNIRMSRKWGFTVLLDAGFDVHTITEGIKDLTDVRVVSRRAKSARMVGVGAARKYDLTRNYKVAQDEGEEIVRLDHPYYGRITLVSFPNVTQQRGGSTPGNAVHASCTRIGDRHVQVDMVLFESGDRKGDPLEIFYAYLRRFTIEHFFRYLKQHWGLTSYKCQQPETFLVWVMVLLVAYTLLPLYEARKDLLPYWMKQRLSTPLAVWCSITALSENEWLKYPVKARGKGTGWPRGTRRKRRERHPARRKNWVATPKTPTVSHWGQVEVVEGLNWRD